MLFAACAESSADGILLEVGGRERSFEHGYEEEGRGEKKGDSMIISKSRTKAAATKCNVGSEFYGALEAHVREVIAQGSEPRAANGRKTLRPQDV